MSNRCCERRVPSASTAQDGETWTCPKCKRSWVHVCDEAEGCWWEPDTDAPTTPKGDAT